MGAGTKPKPVTVTHPCGDHASDVLNEFLGFGERGRFSTDSQSRQKHSTATYFFSVSQSRPCRGPMLAADAAAQTIRTQSVSN